jgi:two-component system response regulator YesN
LDEEILAEVILRVKNKVTDHKIVQDVKEQVKDIEDIKIIDIEMFKKESNNNFYVDKVISYIIENYNKKITFEEVAETLGVSTSYLSRKLKEVSNQTFLDILNKYRIQKSIELLMNGNNRIYEVAYLVGFSEYKHFCTVFKKYTNVPPTKFTKSNMYLAKK